MTPELLTALFNIAAPIVKKIITDHQATTGALPTDDEIKATFTKNIDAYLAEGAAWTASHPNA